MSQPISVGEASVRMPGAPQDDAADYEHLNFPEQNAAEAGRKMEQPSSADRARKPDSDECAAPPQFYRSQREVDAAFSKRLTAERRRWERQKAGSPFTGGGEPSAQRNDEQLHLQNGGQVAELGGAGLPQDGSLAESSQEGQSAEAAQGELSTLMARLADEEGKMRRIYPDFSAAAYLQANPDGAIKLLEQPLWEVALPWVLAQERETARAETLDRVRDRLHHAPDPLRSAGSPGSPAPDYSAMSSEQFGRIRKGFEEQMRVGKKVRS